MTPEREEHFTAVSGSKIHGYGLFVTRPAPAGTRLLAYLGEIIPREESVRRQNLRPEGAPISTVALDDEYDLDGDVPENPAKYANHGCEANAELVPEADGRLALYAARDLVAGEEVLFDYGYGLADSLIHPCRCGSRRCVGRILAEPLRPLLKKHLRRPRGFRS